MLENIRKEGKKDEWDGMSKCLNRKRSAQSEIRSRNCNNIRTNKTCPFAVDSGETNNVRPLSDAFAFQTALRGAQDSDSRRWCSDYGTQNFKFSPSSPGLYRDAAAISRGVFQDLIPDQIHLGLTLQALEKTSQF